MTHAKRYVLWAVAAVALAGCAGPTVSVVHELPPEVPVGNPAAIEPGTFEIAAGEAWMTQFLAAQVAERAAAYAEGATPAAAIPMGGTVTAEVTERRGHRPARRRDRATDRLVTVQVPFLVRTAEVRVVFALGAAGAAPTQIETAAAYNSTEDPRARGRLGLDRGDDPDQVPPAETVLRELLAECAGAAWGMITPVRMPVTLQFHPAGGPEAQAGLRAAEQKDFPAAAEHFRSALEEDPDSPALRANLAAALEGAGRFADAARAYQAAAESADKDAAGPLRAAAERARKLAERNGKGDRLLFSQAQPDLLGSPGEK